MVLHAHIHDSRADNLPRIGRALMAQGRDVADVAITNTFGPNTLQSFMVRAEEVHE